MFVTGLINKTIFKFNNQSASLAMDINVSCYASYQQSNVAVYGQGGIFGKPMPNTSVLYYLTPNGTTGVIIGYANEAPDPEKSTNNIADLEEGEWALSDTKNFNFNIKAKINKLLSTFKNSNNEKIDTNLPISENIVTILIDIINEIKSLEDDYNNFKTNTYTNHTHQLLGVQSGSDNKDVEKTSSSGSQYNPTNDFTRDDTFINQSPSKMFINLDGETIS